MTRAVIYARFSTDLQNEKSTEDQIALCRSHAARRGLQVTQTFEDKARSGCAYQKSNPAVVMMQSTQDRQTENAPTRLDSARDWRVLVQ